MNSNELIMYFVIGCIIFIGLLVFSKPVKALIRVLVQSAIGAACMLIANFLLAPTGIFVGINFLTLLIVGLLGIPGFLAVYIAQAIL